MCIPNLNNTVGLFLRVINLQALVSSRVDAVELTMKKAQMDR